MLSYKEIISRIREYFYIKRKGLIHIGANIGDEYLNTNRKTVLIEPLKFVFDKMVFCIMIIQMLYV